MDLIKELRERTWIGMMECKKALEQTGGDIEAAIDELRKKWLAKAAKKADRETFEGGIYMTSAQGKAFIVSVSCETDFLANSENFKSMLVKVSEFLQEGKWNKEAAQEYVNQNFAMELGENLQVREYSVVDGESFGTYVHSNGKIASLVVGAQWVDEDKLKQVAMHVVAANPEYLSPEEISDDVLEKEKAIQLETMKNDPKMEGKPDQVLLKIIEGKMGKFKSEISLLEQGFVVNPDQKVKDFIGEGNIVSFSRYSI